MESSEGNLSKLAVVMVGLPATGKTFIARNLSRYLRWLAVRTKTFSVANYRNKLIGEKLNADFFDPRNIENLEKRTLIADQALNDILAWFTEANGRVAILDASNTKAERRRTIYERLTGHGIEVMFLECIYNKGHETAVNDHIKGLRLACPEYATGETEHIMEDFTRRLDYYRPHYEIVGSNAFEKTLPYVQLLNGGERLVVNMLGGYLRSKMLYYLMNLDQGPKRIFLFRLPLEKHVSLKDHCSPVQKFLSSSTAASCKDYSVWTETSLISFAIEEIFRGFELLTKPQLRGRDLGLTEGLTKEQVIDRFPEEYEKCQKNSYYHRYPRAESYHDVAVRLENVMMELEKERGDILILADLSVLQCIYAYFTEVLNGQISKIDIPINSIVELCPKAYGILERRVDLSEANDRVIVEQFKPFAEST